MEINRERERETVCVINIKREIVTERERQIEERLRMRERKTDGREREKDGLKRERVRKRERKSVRGI